MAASDWFVHRRGVLTPRQCADCLRAVYAARADWTPCFEGVQFTLGRAYYTHLEEDRADDYFAAAPASDSLVECVLPGLQARVGALIADVVGAPVVRRPGWCGPGLHIFLAGQWLSENGGDIHFDTEGLPDDDRDARVPAMSVIVMLQPPVRGGGLRVWEAVYDGRDAVPDAGRLPSVVVDYAVGDLVAIDSYRLHQIQPFEGPRDRVSVTAHVVFKEGRWQMWF